MTALSLVRTRALRIALPAAAIAALALGATRVDADLRALYAITTVLAAAVALTFALALRAHGRDILAPVFLVLAAIAFYWVVRGYYVAFEPAAVMYYVHRPVRDALATGQWVTQAALAAFVAGYFFAHRCRWLDRLRAALPAQPAKGEAVSPAMVVCVSLAGWIARAAGVYAGNYTKLNFREADVSSTAAVSAGFLAFAACALALAVAAQTRERRWLAIALALTAAEATFALVAGQKTHLLMVAFAVVASLHYGGWRVDWRLLGLCALVFLFVALPAVNLNRHAQNELIEKRGMSAGVILEGVARTPAEVSDHWRELMTGKYTLDELMRRTTTVESVALAVEYTPEAGGYRGGKDYLLAPLGAFAPSFVWPAKPVSDAVDVFTYEYAWAPAYQASPIYPSTTGDLYMNFGLAGVVGGWALFGFGLRLAHRWLVSSSEPTIASVFLYVVVLATALPGIEETVARNEVFLLQRGAMALAVLLLTGAVRLRAWRPAAMGQRDVAAQALARAT